MACGGCEPFDPTQPPGTLTTLVHGAVGVAKAVLRIDRAALRQIAERTATCQGSPARPAGPGHPGHPARPRCIHFQSGGRCQLCKCVIVLKVRVASERCPANLWPTP